MEGGESSRCERNAIDPLCDRFHERLLPLEEQL